MPKFRALVLSTTLLNSPHARRVRGMRGTFRGRRYAEPKHPCRNDFQRDRDRVVHRPRLPPTGGENPSFYPPLFRSFSQSPDTYNRGRTDLPYDCRSTRVKCGFRRGTSAGHDIGHPPFGHAGEKAWTPPCASMATASITNLHALRIVEDFEMRYAGFRGLNLTIEVREASSSTPAITA